MLRAWLVLLLFGCVAGGCTGQVDRVGACQDGEAGAYQAVTDFLEAVKGGDPAAVQEALVEGFSVAESGLSALHSRLDQQDIPAFKVFCEQMGAIYTCRVLDGDRDLATVVNVYVDDKGCHAVAWGNTRPTPIPTGQSSESITASVDGPFG